MAAPLATTTDAPVADPTRADATTARILAATRDLLLEFGLRRTSVEDVAKRAGVARITVYRRFRGRDELILEVLRREAAVVFAEVDRAVAAVADVDDQITEGFVVLLRTARSHPLLQRLLTTDAESLVPSLTTGGAAVVAIGREYLAGHLLEAQAAGRLSATDIRATAEILVRLTLSFLLTPGSAIPLATDDDARQLARRFLLPAIHHRPDPSPEAPPNEDP